ncbi:NUDIX domain-containing protein [Streptomyces sp. LX-29]|uniref:NUDIX hydrolase n=1 Tax=Streptomyces sp. LX-29 TaxID=2900152 RepID=UPI00240D94B6|nr:NUDIX domain-containing protein [Streptomyces sp. LX-29]WFB11359.1 NUDIX domain-containing protein [Streptomyces sp. LX-29]
MSGQQRHREPIDVHLVLRRDSSAGPEVLLSRRAGDVYAAGLWHLPSGHLDGPHEDMADGVIREALEETGVVIDRDDVSIALTVHHRSPHGGARIGVFFEVREWSGRPRVMEPAVCDAMDWYALDALPEPMVAYCRAGLDAYRCGHPGAVHFQHPGDPIRYVAGGPDRTRFLPGPSPAQDPPKAPSEFDERSPGGIGDAEDAPRRSSRPSHLSPQGEEDAAATPRLATPADAAEIARLRSELILSTPLDATWLATCTDQLAARLARGGDARAYVVDAPTGGLATCALGLIHAVLPAPRYPRAWRCVSTPSRRPPPTGAAVSPGPR